MNALANILVKTDGLSHEKWLEYRNMGIGGSDVAPLLGISKWKSPLELWLEKTGRNEDLVQENEAMTWGHIMEPVLRNHFADVTGKAVVEVNAILQHPNYPFMLANVDGVTVDDNGNPAILEIKTASEYKRAEWESGAPIYYQTQIQHYLLVTGLEKAYCAVLIGGNTFRIHTVSADKDVQRMLIALESEFWDKVVRDVRPDVDGSDAATDFLNKMYRGGNKEVITLPDTALDLIEQYHAASEDEDAAKTRKQEAANRLKELLGNHDKATCGEHTVSWTPVTSERLDTKALKANEPEIAKKYTNSSTSRRFVIK